ncbi:hypothetical protein DITRI_Ditri08aG0161500 [Diplodiscus trichospermus]
MAVVFSKILKKTDIEKRLHVPTKKTKCFLNFGGKQKVDFKAIDEDGKVWTFGCSTRERGYPKPVLSKGWLQFVGWWKVEVDDKVILHSELSKVGKEKVQYRIEVIKRATQGSWARLPPLSNHYPDRTMGVASYVEEDPPLSSHTTDQAVNCDQAEGLHEFEGTSLMPHSLVREPKLIEFLKLELG